MRSLLALAAAAALAQPAWAQGVKVVLPPPVSITPLPSTANAKPVSLTRIAANIAAGTPWLTEAIIASPVPLPCGLDPGPIAERWKEGNNRIDAIEPWDRRFRQEVSAFGVPVGGDPTNLFEKQSAGDLQLGALITEIAVKGCSQETLLSETYGGSAVMAVEWQVYSVTQGKVVARIATRGGVTLKQAKDGAPTHLLMGAFGDNARRLAGDPVFRELVTAGAPAVAAAAPLNPLRLATITGRVPMSSAVQGVVSVFAGQGHGSGVLVTADGHILTNHHVAGSGGQVRVRWSDGTETIGDVVRADRRRDVALIKTTPRPSPLPLRATTAQLGETVFAIGTPLDAKFQGSITRGVVSATRLEDGQSFIQSDVSVNPGNSGGPLLDENGAVIGLTVMRMSVDGAPTGINLFIPIDDALKALALTPTS